jgi:hypothetical protein
MSESTPPSPTSPPSSLPPVGSGFRLRQRVGRPAVASAKAGSRTVLVWLERALITIGCALAIWCAIVLVDIWRYESMPVPPPQAGRAANLPGEGVTGTTGTSPPHAAVETGA